MNDRPEIQFHSQLAANWEQLHQGRVFRSRTAAMFGLLDRVPPFGRSWLDAGCGTGTLARLLSQRGVRVQGIDASQAMIDIASDISNRANATDQVSFRLVETIESTPYERSAFDGILCASVLEYTPSPERCIAEFHRVLRPGGLLMLSIPNRRSMLRKLYKLLRPLASRVFTRPVLRYLQYSSFEASIDEVSALLQRHGFTVLDHNFAGSPLPQMLDRQPSLGTLINIVARRDDS